MEHAQPKEKTLEPAVFFPAAIVIFAVVIFAFVAPDYASTAFTDVQSWIAINVGWLYLLGVFLFLGVSIVIAFSSWGRIRLGPQDSTPDYSFTSWFAMLFSAGMGIGLMFYGVAEPIIHFTSPPGGADGGTVEAARQAMVTTFFHWGLHAWAIYVVVGMILAYFSFRHGLPLTIRSALYPLIGERIYGPAGHIVDVIAVIGTLFGVATSLGLGVMQVNSGLSHLFGIPETGLVQVLLIAGITGLATISVVAGLDAGIKRLSQVNLWLALALLAFVFLTGPTVFLLSAFTENLGAYMSDFIPRSFRMDAYGDHVWLSNWTLFYWAWWISWSPFVGMFIARISRGRTLREFILGVLIVPSLFTFLWLTIYGNSAISLELAGDSTIAAAVAENVPVALFVFFENLPFGQIASLLGVVLVITFFVTSSDSGSLVIDTITSGGHMNPPVWQRIFWAVLEGAVAAALLIAGGESGLKGLQTATITAALPFTLVIMVAIIGLFRGLNDESRRWMGAMTAAPVNIDGASIPWRERLKVLVSHPDSGDVESFIAETVRPALEEFAEGVRQHGGEASVSVKTDRARLIVPHTEGEDFIYSVRAKSYSEPHFAFPHIEDDKDREDERYVRAEVSLVEGGQHYSVYGYERSQVIQDVLRQYNRHLQWMHHSRGAPMAS